MLFARIDIDPRRKSGVLFLISQICLLARLSLNEAVAK